MEAILLSHDRQLGLAELVHKSYAHLWPDHPFVFRVPFTRASGSGAFTYLSGQRDCRMIESPTAVKGSMGTLLDGIGDLEWVFWCIDDRFPTRLDAAGAARILADLETLPDEVDEVKLLHWKEPLLQARLTIGATEFRSQAAGSRARGFWHHHFVRARVLRAAFLGDDLAADCLIYAITARIKRRERSLFAGTAQVPGRTLLRLGEPLVEGRLTRNGRLWLKRLQCEVPPYGSLNRVVEFG